MCTAVTVAAMVVPRRVAGGPIEQDPVAYLRVCAVTTPLAIAAATLALARRAVKRAARVAVPVFLARSAAGFVVGAAFFHVGAVLFGAPLYAMAHHTALWAALQASLAAMPACAMFGNPLSSPHWRRVYGDMEFRNHADIAVFYTSITAVVGAWAGAIPIPLDWDRDWQAWPVTLVYGGLLGYLVGAALAAGASVSFERQRAKPA